MCRCSIDDDDDEIMYSFTLNSGGAITMLSNPVDEYDEMLLKLRAVCLIDLCVAFTLSLLTTKFLLFSNCRYEQHSRRSFQFLDKKKMTQVRKN